MAGHTITTASSIYIGDVFYESYANDTGREGRRGVELTPVYYHRYGVLGTADADGVAVTVSTALPTGASTNITITGALATASVATFDAPRGFTITSTGDESGDTFHIYGTDMYGDLMVENLAGPNNTTVQSLKSFLTVSRVNVTSAVTSTQMTYGMGDRIGFPMRATRVDNTIPLVDGNTVTGGGVTFSAGLVATAAAGATTADVRGYFYSSGVVPNASRAYAVMMLIPDTRTRAAVFGVAQSTAV